MKKKDMFCVAFIVMMVVQSLYIFGVTSQPVSIGKTVQREPFESNPTASVVSGLTLTNPIINSYDGNLTTNVNFQYTGVAGSFELNTFNTTCAQFSNIGWVDFKISYRAQGSIDDRYRILYYVGESGPVILQDWVSGASATYAKSSQTDLSGTQAHRTWSNQSKPAGGGWWTWADISSVRVVFETNPVGSADSPFKRIYVYEVWLSVYENPLALPAKGLSVQPQFIQNLGVGSKFFVDIYVSNVTNFLAYQFSLSYDTSVLTAIKYLFFGPFTFPTPSIINDAEGYITMGAMIYGGDPVGFTGSGPIARIYFRVDAGGASILHLYDIEAYDVTARPISLTFQDGAFTSPSIHDVAITDVKPNASQVMSGAIVSINVTALNQGTYPEDSTVTVYYGSTQIGLAQEVKSLVAGGSITLAFYWDTAGVPPSNYMIKAVASVVPGETHTSDNTFIDGMVIVGRNVAVLRVDPPSIVDPALGYGSTFSLNITVAEVSKLWGYQVFLRYNTTVLTARDFQNLAYLTYPEFTMAESSGMNDTEGLVYVSYHASFGDHLGLTTFESKPLLKITFQVDARGTSALHIDEDETRLVDIYGDGMIPPYNLELRDGFFDNTAASGLTLLSVEPRAIVEPELDVGSTFPVNITVADVRKLWGYQIQLRYNTTLLTATGFENLANLIYSEFTIEEASYIDDATGFVFASFRAPFGDRTGLTATGFRTLLTITFRVDARGKSALHIDESLTRLVDIYGDGMIPPYNLDLQDGFFDNTAASGLTLLSVDPRTIVEPELGVGSTFFINITVADVQKLWGYQIQMRYNTTLLTATGFYNLANLTYSEFAIEETSYINDAVGLVSASFHAPFGDRTGLTTTGPIPLLAIAFRVDARGKSALHMDESLTRLVDIYGDAMIPQYNLDLQDGFFDNTTPLPLTVLSVQPTSIVDSALLPSSVFRISVTVENVQNLFTQEFELRYDTRVLTATNVGLYPPFENFAGPTPEINDVAGYVYLAAYTHMPDLEGLSTIPPRVIAWIEFKVDDFGTSALHLCGPDESDYLGGKSILGTIYGEPIPHEDVDGFFDNRINFVKLDITVEVGSIHFPSEMAEFYVLTSIAGERVDAEINATLYFGGAVFEDLNSKVERIGLGLYRIPYTIPVDASSGTYVLVVESNSLRLKGVSIKSFLLSSTLTGWNAELVSIDGAVGTVKTDLGVIKVDLGSINPRLTALSDTVATIQTSIGSIVTDIGNIEPEVTEIDGVTATIQTTLGSIVGTITSVQDDVATIVTDVGTVKTILDEWKGKKVSLVTHGGAFEVLVLTTSTIEDPIAFSDNVLTMSLSGQPGTSGSTSIMVPKQLLVGLESRIEKIAVTVDDEKTSFTYSEQPEAYVLSIAYAHSRHTVKVYLAGLPSNAPSWGLYIIAAAIIALAVVASLAVYVVRVRKRSNEKVR